MNLKRLYITTAIMGLCGVTSSHAETGMTWTKYGVDDVSGVVSVGCGFTPGVNPPHQCNAYQGDTSCEAELPLLCFLDTGLEKPEGLQTGSTNVWSGGVVATTVPVKGSSFNTLAEADQFCKDSFGGKWRVAEFHDGWGWGFTAYGNVGDNYNDSKRRVWVDIDNQPANCWD